MRLAICAISKTRDISATNIGGAPLGLAAHRLGPAESGAMSMANARDLPIFEPVSAGMQPGAGHSLTKNSDIENSTSGDPPPDLRLLVRAARIYSQGTEVPGP